MQYDSNGNLITKFAGHGSHESGLLGDGIDLKLDKKGNLYAADPHSTAGSIKKYSADGFFLQKYGRQYNFTNPVYDKYNNLYFYDGEKRNIHKYDATGGLVLKFNANVIIGTQYSVAGMIAVDLKGYIYLYEAGDNRQRIIKFSRQGVYIKAFDLELPKPGNEIVYSKSFSIDKNGIMHIADGHGGVIHKVSADGSYLGAFGKKGLGSGEFSYPQSVAFDGIGFMYVLDYNGNRIQKFSPSGKLMMEYGDKSSNTPSNFSNLAVDENGNAILSYYSNYGSHIKMYNQDGTLTKQIELINYGVAVTNNGKTFAAKLLDRTVAIYSLQNEVPDSYISGFIYEDKNRDCLKNEDENGLSGVIVAAEPGPYYGISDNNGFYHIRVPKGTYTVNQVPDNSNGRFIEQSCFPNQTVTLQEDGASVSGPNIGNKVTLSPHLSVSVSSTRRRRCFDSTTRLTYTNSGFAPANNAKVYFELPKEVELLSADKPYTRLPNGTYVFDAGTINPGKTSVITIQDKVVCGDESIRGLTVCTKAWITPGNQSPTAPPAAVATVTGKCDFDKGMVRFVIRNTGQADMDARKVFRLYLDGQLSTVEEYKLAAGDSLVLWIPNGGKTARLEAEQPAGNGDNTLANATVEACHKTSAPVPYSTGFVNAMQTDDEEAEVAEECLPIIDSYDPNDKLVSPIGLTEENYTPTGAALKYKIRFQNTGTDVAYRVVVVDTLSGHLDLSTLQLGSTSHSARFEVSGKGKPVLTWTFDNIMLPDSTTNEPGSHGYIQFSIKPKVDLAEKTAVENFADIFFDFNSPIRTNITTNRIYDMPPVMVDAVKLTAEEIIATPGINSFAPAAGKYGSEVILSGSKFSTTAAANKVYFNGVQSTVISATETELKVLVPNSSATGNIKVVTPDGTATASETFEVYQPPVFSSFSPAEGIFGSTVTLQGKQLDQSLIQSIKLGSYNCEIISNNGTTLLVKVPAQAVTGKFEIVTKGGKTVSSSAFIVWHQPAINSLSKHTDKVGATISINGENFAAAKERNKVMFGQVQAQVLSATTTQLTVKVPAGPASGYLTVETPGGKATSATYFDVIPSPVFVSMSPAKGNVGTTIEITGTYFGTLGVQDEITFNGVTAQVLEATATSYNVKVPRGATTGKVKITGVGGEAFSTSDFVIEVFTPARAIEVYPNPTTGNFTISFLHADFDLQDVQIYTTTGRLIHTAALPKPRPEKLDVNIAAAKPGMYLLQIKTDKGIVTKKLSVL
ncbi:IPT/TIG domain-containing protein [Pontibacter aydingkolensis]|uniref:IPT/TIG domain-containing protein n=1 Tax=Pontibacter aydingkolensis TaxID=1911536 RepID=A0ABS7CY03_9BACT|nr:IPT/TIG domain-containing protein [Pontibacter aydingkolensis]